MIPVLSLCSGYGGLDMGLEDYELMPPTEVVAACDIDPHARAVLAQHYPEALIFHDLTDPPDYLPHYEIVTAGFPCQPVSVAGKQQAHADERWLIDDIVRLYRPILFLFENVPGLLNYGNHPDGSSPMGRVLSALADAGYDARWTTVAASDAGACHRRDRVFITATANTRSLPEWAQPFA